jgi:hypothetical protein
LNEVKTTEAYGYVMKPFQTEAIHAAIQLALNRREKELRHNIEERRRFYVSVCRQTSRTLLKPAPVEH